MRRRIVHVITGLPVGGAQTMLLKLVRRMDPGRFESEIVSLLDRGAMAERFESAGFGVRALDMRRDLRVPLAIARLVRWLREDPPDIVQTWMYHADLLGGLAARMAGIRAIVWGIHQSHLDPRGTKRSTRWIASSCARLSRHVPKRIVCCSEASRRAHQRLGYAPERMLTIPNGFDLDEFRPDEDARRSVRRELGLDEGTLLVGLVGRFDPQKDHRTFLRAAGKALRDRPDVEILLCGEDVTNGNPALSTWIDEARLNGRCHRLGRRDDVSRLTAALDVAVSSSYSEALPSVVGEAMASGVPCVVTDVGDSAEMVGDTGRVVEPEDPGALAREIVDLLDRSHEERRWLGGAARVRVTERYALDRVVHRYEDLYEEIVAGTIR